MDLVINLGQQYGNREQSVEEYLENFNWNNFKFKMADKPLSVLGATLMSL